MLAAVDVFAFDKTGTLTNGRAAVTRIVALDGDERGFLSLLAGLEAHSEHRVAAAIRREAAARGIAPAHVVDVSARPSAGIVGSDALGVLWAGNLHLVRDMGASVDHAGLRELTDSAETVVYLGRGRPFSAPSAWRMRRGRARPRRSPRCGPAACAASS